DQAGGLGSDALAFEILDGLNGGIVGDNEDPARRIRGGSAVLQVADDVNVGPVLGNPVLAGDAAIEEAVVDVARDLLGADQPELELGIVDAGTVGALGAVDAVTGLPEEVHRRLEEAALGQADLEEIVWCVRHGGSVKCRGCGVCHVGFSPELEGSAQLSVKLSSFDFVPCPLGRCRTRYLVSSPSPFLVSSNRSMAAKSSLS